MTTHLITYIKRSLANEGGPTNTYTQAPVLALLQPAGHGTKRRSMFVRYKGGEELIVWLLSLLRLPDGTYMPPSLDARIAVRRAFQRGDNVPKDEPYARYLL